MSNARQDDVDPFPDGVAGFRARCLARGRLIGTFVKSPAHQGVEVLGLAGLDFVILDAEHAPIDRDVIDRAVLAGAATGIAVLVRVTEGSADLAAAALDLGAAGIVFPHIGSAAEAREAVSCVRFAGGSRGLSPSVRAAGYGAMTSAAFARTSDASVTVWVQIEDAQALGALEEIAAVPGVDALFVGRVDLARSLGVDVASTAIAQETDRILRAAANAGRGGAVFSSDVGDAKVQFERGASIAVVSSDLGLMKTAALDVVSRLRDG